MSQKTLHISGLLLAIGVLAFELQMPPRIAATLIYLFVIVLGLRRSLAESKRFLKCTLECLDSNIAILDDQGKILMLNSSRNPFSHLSHSKTSHYKTGANYFELCEAANSETWSIPGQLLKGIRRVIKNRGDEFRFEYSCQSVLEEDSRSYTFRVTRFEQDGEIRIIVAHDDITEFRSISFDDAHEPGKVELAHEFA